MKRREPYRGIRIRMLATGGLLLLGAVWLALRLVLAQHDVVAAVAVVVLGATIVGGNRRAAQAARSVAPPFGPRHPGAVADERARVPEDIGRRAVPEVRLSDDVEPPRPKLGAPGSLN